jgi:hypothetical protein
MDLGMVSGDGLELNSGGVSGVMGRIERKIESLRRS